MLFVWWGEDSDPATKQVLLAHELSHLLQWWHEFDLLQSAVEELIDALCARHGISRSRIYGHRQLHPTQCPGDPLMAWVSRYASGASH